MGGFVLCLSLVFFYRWPYGTDRKLVTVYAPNLCQIRGLVATADLVWTCLDLLAGPCDQPAQPGICGGIILERMGGDCRAREWTTVRSALNGSKISADELKWRSGCRRRCDRPSRPGLPSTCRSRPSSPSSSSSSTHVCPLQPSESGLEGDQTDDNVVLYLQTASGVRATANAGWPA